MRASHSTPMMMMMMMMGVSMVTAVAYGARFGWRRIVRRSRLLLRCVVPDAVALNEQHQHQEQLKEGGW